MGSINKYWVVASAISLGFLSMPAFGQAYKCVVGGKTVYADAPCAANAKSVSALEDRVSRDQVQERRRVVQGERGQLGEIQAADAAYRRQHARDVEAVAANDRATASMKASRCSAAQRDLQSSQRAVAVYKDVGWQNSINQRKAEQDAAERRVRDECN